MNWLIKYKLFEHFITKQSSCAQHTEAKPTKTSDFGAVKGLLESSRKNGWLVLKILDLVNGFGGETFLGKIWGAAAGCMTFFWLVDGKLTGRCSRNLAFSMSLPSST